MIATVALWLALATGVPCGGPGPDPSPGTVRPVTCIDRSYDYDLPAMNADTGEDMPQYYFRCHHEKGSRADLCVLHRRGVKLIWRD